MSIASFQFTIPMRKHRLHTSYTNFENTTAITMFFFLGGGDVITSVYDEPRKYHRLVLMTAVTGLKATHNESTEIRPLRTFLLGINDVDITTVIRDNKGSRPGNVYPKILYKPPRTKKKGMFLLK